MTPSFLVATRKGLFFFRKGGARRGWSIKRVAFLADNVSIVFRDAASRTLYAALDHGHFGVKLHRSENDGKTWTEVAAPAYPEPKPGDAWKDFFGRDVPQKLVRIWSLAAGGGTLWCGTLPGGLFSSSDRGETWVLNRPLWEEPLRKKWTGGGADWPGIHSICVHPADPRRVVVAVSSGGVWQTDDGGRSWTATVKGMWAAYVPPEQKENPEFQDPHIVVRCPAAPDAFWCQHHNGIFKSVDGARTWTEIKKAGPSTFGFSVAVHPADPKTAWFVPATKDEKRIPVDGRLVVTRTADGGRSFRVLSKGLPQKDAYDIVWRHALDVDAAGRRLAFGTTTGNLFISENAGDTWTHVSAHLPPVHAVRFMG